MKRGDGKYSVASNQIILETKQDGTSNDGQRPSLNSSFHFAGATATRCQNHGITANHSRIQQFQIVCYHGYLRDRINRVLDFLDSRMGRVHRIQFHFWSDRSCFGWDHGNDV